MVQLIHSKLLFSLIALFHSALHNSFCCHSMGIIPQNPYWPESGVGLTSKFSVGDDGANCDLCCGWDNATLYTLEQYAVQAGVLLLHYYLETMGQEDKYMNNFEFAKDITSHTLDPTLLSNRNECELVKIK